MAVWDRIRQKAARKKIPLMVHLDLTYRCHQRCIHCYLPESYRRGETANQELSTAQIKDILDQLAEAGAFLLTLSGGEVFLRPDLLAIVEYGRRRNFLISFLTSGTWGMGEEQLRALAEIGIEALIVSLYSLDARVHDEITGVPGSLGKLQNTIKRCQAAGLQVVFNCSALGSNYLGVPALKDYAEQEGIPLRLSPGLVNRWDGQPHPTGLRLADENWTRLFHSLHEEDKEESLTVSPDWEAGGCKAGINSCYINPAGKVWPCVDVPWLCGSLTDGESFQRIWRDSPIMRQVRSLQEEIVKSEEILCDFYRKWKTPQKD